MVWGERKGAVRGDYYCWQTLACSVLYSQILTYQKRVGGGGGLFEALVSIIHGMLLLPPIVVLIAKLYEIS